MIRRLLSRGDPLALARGRGHWVAECQFEALGHSVLVRTNSEKFAPVMRSLMSSFPASNGSVPDPEVVFSVDVSDEPDRSHRFYRDGKLIRETGQYWKLMRLLEWQLDRLLVHFEKEHLLLHAGSVALDGAGILMPGTSRAGKSSLTIALLLRGGSYFSDEISAVSLETGELVAFPKALSCRDISMFPELDRDAWLGPSPEEELAEPESDGWAPAWFIRPEDVRRGCVADPAPVTHVIFPTRSGGGAPVLERLDGPEAMRRILRHSINFPGVREPAFHQAARIVSRAKCYELKGDGLAEAADLVVEAATHPGN